MRGNLPLRIYSATKGGGEWPRFSDDDVLDFVVREAMLAKVTEFEQKQAKKQERDEFRKSHRELQGSGAAAWQREMTANG